MDGLTGYSVSKAIILVEDEVARHYLMSIKRDLGSDNEGKLEFLGGRMDEGESPTETIIRELAEEEATGNLSNTVKARASMHVEHQIGNATHFLFPLQISLDEYESLCHHPDESYGFRLIATEKLSPCPDQYTRKTNRIINLLELSESGIWVG